MPYSVHRDESNYSDAKLLAWEAVLPFMYLPILDSDTHRAKNMEDFMERAFTESAMNNAVTKLKLRKK
jgi:hypothetical protein